MTDPIEDDNLLPPGAFLAPLPWWVLLGREPAPGPAATGGGSPPSPPGYFVLDADGSTCLAVFTDQDLAERFVGAAGMEGEAVAVEEPRQFALLVGRLPPVCTHAAFDPPPRVGARARWVVPVAEVLRALEAAADEAAGEP